MMTTPPRSACLNAAILLEMKKFKITFVDEIEAENEEAAYKDLLDYLRDVVKYDDVTAFDFKDISPIKKDMIKDTMSLDVMEATLCHAAQFKRIEETYGYTASIDCLINMVKVCELFEKNPHDIKMIIKLNRDHKILCSLDEAVDKITEWLPERT